MGSMFQIDICLSMCLFWSSASYFVHYIPQVQVNGTSKADPCRQHVVSLPLMLIDVYDEKHAGWRCWLEWLRCTNIKKLDYLVLSKTMVPSFAHNNWTDEITTRLLLHWVWLLSVLIGFPRISHKHFTGNGKHAITTLPFKHSRSTRINIGITITRWLSHYRNANSVFAPTFFCCFMKLHTIISHLTLS